MTKLSDANLEQAPPVSQGEVSETIARLDIVVQALLTDLPSAKPWQRHLKLQLAQAARCLQVLRMCIAMQRSKEDIREAARRVQQAMHAANTSAESGRADMGTKTIVSIAYTTSQRINKALR